MYKNFDIREELQAFRYAVMVKHPNLTEEVKALESYHHWDRKSKALALKEIMLKVRIDPEELNAVYLIKKLDKILAEV